MTASDKFNCSFKKVEHFRTSGVMPPIKRKKERQTDRETDRQMSATNPTSFRYQSKSTKHKGIIVLFFHFCYKHTCAHYYLKLNFELRAPFT